MKFLAFFYLICAALAVVPPLSPLSIQSDFPVPYFGPIPSSNIDPSMIGPAQLLNSTIDINLDEGTITLPLYRGTLRGQSGTVWYIVTDTADLETSLTLGVHYSPKLAFVSRNLMRTATGSVSFDLSGLEFESGAVNFNARRQVIPGQSPDFWPLDSSSTPGSVADDDYTSLVLLPERIVLNAPIVASSDATEDDLNAYCDGISNAQNLQAKRILHDKVISICPRENRITLNMTYALSFSRPFWYLALEVSDPLLAALEGATHVPRMSEVAVDCWNVAACPTEALITMVNGYTNDEFTPMMQSNFTMHPLRQGLNSAAQLRGEWPAIHVMGEIPTLGIHQSPYWDMFITQWNDIALDQNLRTRVRDIFEAFGYSVERLLINYPEGNELVSSGNVFNAPAVYRLY